MKLNKAKIRRNLRNILEQAGPKHIQDGKDWYFAAKRWSVATADLYNVPIKQAVGVLAALSPSVYWHINKKQADRLIEGYTSLSSIEGIEISTYKRQLNKAIEILELSPEKLHDYCIMDILGKRAYKTRPFYHNILYPESSGVVTIDQHIWNACRLPTMFINKGNYRTISEIICKLARNRDILPSQLQAIIWLTYKEMSKDLPI